MAGLNVLKPVATAVMSAIVRSLPEILCVCAMAALVRGVYMQWGSSWAWMASGALGVGMSFLWAASAPAQEQAEQYANVHQPIRQASPQGGSGVPVKRAG
jgi:hypothetical protein